MGIIYSNCGNYFYFIESYNLCIDILVEYVIMFIGNSCNDCMYNRLEMKNVDKNILPWFEDIIDENNCRIERKEWKSKYNSYVTYDYEPFCSEGFEINVIVSARDLGYLNFFKYLYTEKVNTIDFLNNCMKIPTIKNYI